MVRRGWIGWSRDIRGVPKYHCVEVCNTITSQMGGTTTPLIYEYNSETLFNEGEDKAGMADVASVPGDWDRQGCVEHHNGSDERLYDNGNLRIVRTVKRERTEHCKALRRLYGDYSGMVRFSDKQFNVGSKIMNTITTLSNKDNLIMEITI